MDGAPALCSARAHALAGVLGLHALVGTLPPVEHVCAVAGVAGGAASRGAEASAGIAAAADMARDVGCALRTANLGVGGTRAFTSVLLSQGAPAGSSAGRSPRRVSASASEAQRRHAAVQRAFLEGSNATSPVVVSAITSDAPTVRAIGDEHLPRGRCTLLLLHMSAPTANLRQSLRVDLPHILRLGALDALVVGLSATPCKVFPPGVKARDLNASDKYSGPLCVRAAWKPRNHIMQTALAGCPARGAAILTIECSPFTTGTMHARVHARAHWRTLDALRAFCPSASDALPIPCVRSYYTY
jgi:hypothetical protein